MHTSQLHETTRFQAHLGPNCNDLSVEHEDLFRSLDWKLRKQTTGLPDHIAERELKEME